VLVDGAVGTDAVGAIVSAGSDAVDSRPITVDETFARAQPGSDRSSSRRNRSPVGSCPSSPAPGRRRARIEAVVRATEIVREWP